MGLDWIGLDWIGWVGAVGVEWSAVRVIWYFRRGALAADISGGEPWQQTFQEGSLGSRHFGN